MRGLTADIGESFMQGLLLWCIGKIVKVWLVVVVALPDKQAGAH